MKFIFLLIFNLIYYVQFEDAYQINEGMEIYFKGIKIGEVEEVFILDLKPNVKISIKKKYKDLIREGCAIKFSEGKLELIGVDEKNRVLPEGSKLKGLRKGLKDEILYEFEKLKEKIKKSDFKDEFERLIEEMDRAYQKGKEEFEKKWPYFKEKLKELKEKIKE